MICCYPIQDMFRLVNISVIVAKSQLAMYTLYTGLIFSYIRSGRVSGRDCIDYKLQLTRDRLNDHMASQGPTLVTYTMACPAVTIHNDTITLKHAIF